MDTNNTPASTTSNYWGLPHPRKPPFRFASDLSRVRVCAVDVRCQAVHMPSNPYRMKLFRYRREKRSAPCGQRLTTLQPPHIASAAYMVAELPYNRYRFAQGAKLITS